MNTDNSNLIFLSYSETVCDQDGYPELVGAFDSLEKALMGLAFVMTDNVDNLVATSDEGRSRYNVKHIKFYNEELFITVVKKNEVRFQL